LVAVVACDLIFPSAPILLALADSLRKTGADVAVVRTRHGFEPFHAVYRRERCMPLVRAALEEGQAKATVWYEKARLDEFTHEEILAIDPRGGSFINVNTPEELAEMQQRIREGSISEAADFCADAELAETLSLSGNRDSCDCSFTRLAQHKGGIMKDFQDIKAISEVP
jgi:hypothetical protein